MPLYPVTIISDNSQTPCILQLLKREFDVNASKNKLLDKS